ncbi:MAG: YfhO family protein [Legionellaceae bacterium]|nr:YfhO family protein [Legionellaceae bacterium]
MHTLIKNRFLSNTKISTRFSLDKLVPILVAVVSLFMTPWSLTDVYSRSAITVALATIILSLFCIIFKINRRFFLVGLILIGLSEVLVYKLNVQRTTSSSTELPMEYSLVRKTKYIPTRKRPFEDDYYSVKYLGVTYGITGSYLQEDYSQSPRQDLISMPLKKLLESRKDIYNKKQQNDTSLKFNYENVHHIIGPSKYDEEFNKVIGYTVPKLRLTSEVVLVENTDEALKKTKDTDIYKTPILTIGNNAKIDDVTKQIIPPDDTIQTQEFSNNRLRFSVINPTKSTLWLTYADTYNKNWKAFVDSKPEQIYPANVAFKAIQIKPGKHEVLFVYSRSAIIFIAFFAFMVIAATLFLVAMIYYSLLNAPKDSNLKKSSI